MSDEYDKTFRLINIRARRDDVDRWKEHAHKRRLSLSKLIRTLLDQDCDMSRDECKHQWGQGSLPPHVDKAECLLCGKIATGAEIARTSPDPAQFQTVRAEPIPKTLTALESLVTKAKANQKCERRLPKGAFCKFCGRIHP